MFGIGVVELIVFGVIFVLMAAAGFASTLLIIRTMQQRQEAVSIHWKQCPGRACSCGAARN